MPKSVHISVMLDEALEYLQAEKGGHFLDCTLGGCGHTKAILDANPDSLVTGCDRDIRAIERSASILDGYQERVKVKQASFSQIAEKTEGQKFDGILADLGISSDQLVEGRTFSFQDDARLDMRMDESQELSAYDVVNFYPPPKLLKVLSEGGVGKETRAVVRAIMDSRPLETAVQLKDLLAGLPCLNRFDKKRNPATVVFQAIRMEVNGELAEISALLEAIPSIMKPGGRLVIISFHSLEDRKVASCMRKWGTGDTAPALWRGAEPEEKPIGKLLTRKALFPTEREVKENPRSRSARLRCFSFL